ncbi:hypothetical protein FA95DRAFT_1554078 [Auriscalpium vulgare]|uniref:Uncharacterized protein n=1 Tax=Auriscalpium vulgare TaxID=40419 RepID=A0ACB8S5S5_9AGAM|nr:hypothetical protein FA95DRAFT_1554078 [Auriscalpium vulgare]
MPSHSHSNSQLSLASSSSTSSSQLSTPPPTPQRVRKQPDPIRLHSIGVDPSQLIGKTLTRVRCSRDHPSVTLYFADKTVYQVRVDGYDPVHRGVPKELETNSMGGPVFRPQGGEAELNHTVAQCRFVKLRDTAYEWSETADSRWNVEHLALAMNFEEDPGWRCVWATMAEYDGRFGRCTFRSFDDVYLDEVRPSARKRRSHAAKA